MHAVTTEAVRRWPLMAHPGRTPSGEELWMQNEDVTSAWAVFALTTTAVALLIVLAVLG